jgi:tetratricopeptide (TPR) repeat protein
MAGDVKKACEAAKAVVEFGEKHSSIRAIGLGYIFVGYSRFVSGDYTSAIDACHKAAEVSSDPFYTISNDGILAACHTMNGNYMEALDSMQNIASYSRQAGMNWVTTTMELFLGATLIAVGEMNQGFEMIQECRQRWLHNGRKYWYATSEYVLSTVHLLIVLGKGEMSFSTMLKNLSFLLKTVPFASRKAERHFLKAIEVAEEIGAKGIAGQAYLDLGRLHKAKKRKDKARECVFKAIEYFELCEAETYLKQAREELETLG